MCTWSSFTVLWGARFSGVVEVFTHFSVGVGVYSVIVSGGCCSVVVGLGVYGVFCSRRLGVGGCFRLAARRRRVFGLGRFSSAGGLAKVATRFVFRNGPVGSGVGSIVSYVCSACSVLGSDVRCISKIPCEGVKGGCGRSVVFGGGASRLGGRLGTLSMRPVGVLSRLYEVSKVVVKSSGCKVVVGVRRVVNSTCSVCLVKSVFGGLCSDRLGGRTVRRVGGRSGFGGGVVRSLDCRGSGIC